MTVIYIDRVFLLNAVVDYVLLLCAAQLAGIGLHRWRLALCAGLGGLYAALTFLPALPALSHPVCKIASGVAMALLAYGKQPHRWRLLGLFLLLAGGLAGVMLAAGLLLGQPNVVWQGVYQARIDWRIFLAATGLFALLLRLIFRGIARRAIRGNLLPIRVLLEGRELSLRAMRDTGNGLRDPARGLPVLVAERRAFHGFFAPQTETVLDEDCPVTEKLLHLQKSPQAVIFACCRFRASARRTDCYWPRGVMR
jgi:stage II sporulation protein GA (sporulation sigma-E factor processing peptidase)